MNLEVTHVESGEYVIETEQDYDDYMRRYRERRRNNQIQTQSE